MNTIKKIKNLYKALFGTFTDEEFSKLCNEYSNVSGLIASPRKTAARRVLKVFFAHQIPTHRQLTFIYSNGDELRWLYLSNLSKKRHLSDDEQMFLATLMNFGPVFRFPQKINDKAVARLFESGNVRRIATYLRDFAVPEHFELELIKRYSVQNYVRREHKSLGNDYRFALECYLDSSHKNSRCKSQKVQAELLKVADDDLLSKLCANQNLTQNLLDDTTIHELIAKGYKNALRSLLMHSFIPTVELQRYLYSTFPELKWELEISKVRHALRKIEIGLHSFSGVEAPNYEEMKIIDKAILAEGNLRFIEEEVHPLLKSRMATPYFCAWAAHEYPSLGEEAYMCLRALAESYKKDLH